jgi:hypothetical protein
MAENATIIRMEKLRFYGRELFATKSAYTS